jgi:phage terminase large subunit-like protein
MGKPRNVYFVHLDPATSSHNYALAVVHKEFYLNHETQKADFKIIVDHIKYWQPINGAINPNAVMQYVINLKRRFHIGLITYDAFTSQESILKMRKAGIPNKETKFLPAYKFTIYKELENLVNTGRLMIPYENLLYQEMIELQRKFTPTGFKVLPKQDGDGVKSDDVVDCIAGACYTAVERQMSKLPNAKLANLGNPGGNQIAWRTMQGGVYGVGSGGQVAKSLEQRSTLWKDLNNSRGRQGRYGR